MAKEIADIRGAASGGSSTTSVGNRGESTLSPRHWIAVLLIAGSIALIWWWSSSQKIQPVSTAADDDVLLILPTLTAGESKRERQLSEKVLLTPHDIVTVSTLVQLYIERSRRESDPRYLGYAQQLLDPWWLDPSPPPAIQRLRAILLQGQHRFQQALADLDALLRRYPHDAQSLLTRATVYQVLGNYSQALADCLRLSRYASLHAVACTASILSLTGRAASAQTLLARVAPQLGGQTVATRQWALTLRGEIAERENKIERARRYYKLALDESIRSAYLLRVYSQLLLREGQPREVLTLLREQTHDDTLLLHAAIAAQRAGDSELLLKYTRLIESRLRNARLRGSASHYYLAGRFALEIENLPDKALGLARSNWLQTKEPRDTELFAAAALANGDQDSLSQIAHWMSLQNAVLPQVVALLKVKRVDL
jgi:tetratricopeptide (TPR) repeat protein